MSEVTAEVKTVEQKALAEIGKLAADVRAEFTKVKTIWTRWEPYACLVVGVVAGGFAVHALHL